MSGIATSPERSDATNGAPGLTTKNKDATRNKTLMFCVFEKHCKSPSLTPLHRVAPYGHSPSTKGHGCGEYRRRFHEVSSTDMWKW